VSSVTGESKALVEMHWVQRRLDARRPVWELPARAADALLLLDREMTLIKEGARGE
jgi:hypothetical protein